MGYQVYSYRDYLNEWAACDLSKQHFSTSRKLFDVQNGKMEDFYGWAYNRWFNSACFCRHYPKTDLLNRRITKVKNLAVAFNKMLENYLILIEEREIKSLRIIKNKVYEHIKASYVGFESTNCTKPSRIVHFNDSIKKIEKWLIHRVAFCARNAPQLIEIRKSLKAWNWSEKRIRSFLAICFQRLSGKITHSEFDQRLTKQWEKYRYPQFSLGTWKKECEDLLPSYNWNGFIPPSDPEVSRNVRDFEILYQRLEDSLPDQQHWEELQAERRSIPNISEQTFIESCKDLMNLSIRIMESTSKDLLKLKENSRLTEKELAELLCSQKKGSATYLFRTFILLPKAYRMIANFGEFPQDFDNSNLEVIPENWRTNFHKEGTLQNEWRLRYNQAVALILDLIGKENLEAANKQLAVWSGPHELNDYRFLKRPH